MTPDQPGEMSQTNTLNFVCGLDKRLTPAITIAEKLFYRINPNQSVR